MVWVHPPDAVYGCVYATIWYAVDHCSLIPDWLKIAVRCWIVLELLFLLYGKFRCGPHSKASTGLTRPLTAA